jgi:hypothetical protein
MYSSFCLFQDVLTKKIFSRDIREGGYIMWMIWILVKFILLNHHSGKDKTSGYGIIS